MHVLFLIHRYPPAVGGSERLVAALARRLAAEGHRATIYTSDLLDVAGFWQRGHQRLAGGVSTDEGVKVRRFPARVLPLHGAASRALGLVPWTPIGLTMTPPGLVMPGLWKAVRQARDWDLVHASAYPSLMYLGAVAARRSGAGLVLMPCSHPGVEGEEGHPRHYLSRRLARVYSWAGAVLALTPSERDLLIREGAPATRVHVTGVGIDPEEAAGSDGGRFRQRFGVPDDAPLVTFIGHKTPGKGVLHLLDACEALLAARPALTFAFVGAPTPEFVRRYRALPDALRPRVLNLRLTEGEKHDLLAASQMLVLPSREDSFGIVLLEAWLHSKPVIGARAGGIPDVVQEGETGLLVPYGDTPALAQAMARLLDRPAEAGRMGRCGRERALQNWTWEAVYRRVQAAYMECLGR